LRNKSKVPADFEKVGGNLKCRWVLTYLSRAAFVAGLSPDRHLPQRVRPALNYRSLTSKTYIQLYVTKALNRLRGSRIERHGDPKPMITLAKLWAIIRSASPALIGYTPSIELEEQEGRTGYDPT
jgi:hypothetical protein